MEKYDVAAIGGGVAGSVAARIAAENGLNSLLIERAKTPRDKPCSGIQFTYFEKLVGRTIPKDKLCSNEIFNMHIITPEGNTYKGKMKVLNFWRSTFDRWLNDLAAEEGATFQDKTRMVDFEQREGGIRLQLKTNTEAREVFARYVIAADGMSSKVRKKLRPDDYLRKAPGGAMNYYCTGEGDLDPNALYMVNIKEFAPIMFAWIYKKDDLWVIGTGAESDLKGYADRFYDYTCKKYNFKGEIVRKEGFASPLKGGVYLGEDNILVCGDAAGLLDAYRGVAMDNAALSARFAVQAILEAEKTGTTALPYYRHKMRPMKRQMEINEVKRQAKFASDETLSTSLSSEQMLKDGVKMLAANFVNKFLPPEKVFTLPF
jgi:digeranylgeranylglycerophospholipid reductase